VSHRLVVLALAVFVLSCGGKKDSNGSGGGNPLNPTGNFGGLGDAKGRIIATINGTAYTFGATASVQTNFANPALNSITFGGTTADLSRQITLSTGHTLIRTLTFGFNAATGLPLTDPAHGNVANATIIYAVHVPTGVWSAGPGAGTGTFTITTLSATASTGAFTGMLAPGTGTTGTVNVTSGQYNITF
jgi:hypothetical protein